MPAFESVSLVLPAYNEVGRIANTVETCRAYFRARGYRYEIIVAADGDDGTREVVAEMAQRDLALKVIGSAERQGKGHGIRQGVALASGEIVGFADADDKTPIEEFDKFVPFLREGYELVIGSRVSGASHVERPQPLHRRLGSKGFTLFRQLLLGMPEIQDSQCGFKFFPHKIAKDLFRRQRIDGYMFDAEILYLAHQSRYRIAQVPVRWRDDRDSRFALISGSIRDFREMLSIRFGPSRPASAPALAERAAGAHE